VAGTASAENETSPKSATASCPAGKKAVSGGYVLQTTSGSLAELSVSQNYPSSDTTWSVTAAEDNDSGVGAWSIQAYVICVTST
jgi:hypothetical protein